MKIKGIDIVAGMESVNNDEEVYQEILQIYYEDGVAMLDVLKQNIQNTDLQLFITHTHAMKSASKGIGADEVSERFKEMEFAGKEKNFNKIEEKFPACLEAFEELLGNLKQYLEGGSVCEGESAVAHVLKAMKVSLEEMDTDIFEEYLEKLEKEETDAILQTKLQEIRVAYDDFDFAQTISIIDQLL